MLAHLHLAVHDDYFDLPRKKLFHAQIEREREREMVVGWRERKTGVGLGLGLGVGEREREEWGWGSLWIDGREQIEREAVTAAQY